MDRMFGGILRGHRKEGAARRATPEGSPAPAPERAREPAPAPAPTPAPDGVEPGGDDPAALAPDFDLHFCVCCDRPLGDDPEDEIDGEGPGADICGNCNRERNWLAIDSMEIR